MATFIEPLIIQGINRDVAPGALDYSGRTVLNPVRDVLNARYLTSEGGQSGKVEHIKGTVSLGSFAVYQQVTQNSDFQDSLDPWLQLEDGDLELEYDSGKARMASSDIDDFKCNTIYQENNLGIPKVGELAKFTVTAQKSANYLMVRVYGRFLDASFNVLDTFIIGTVNAGLPVTFEVLKSVPAGTRHFGCFMHAFGLGGSATADLDRFKVDATIEQSFPAGQNVCIGAYENVEKNSVFFLLWNSNGYHGVYSLNGSDNSIMQICGDDPDSPVLDFDRNHLITGIGMIGDILTWTDNRKPQRYINVTRQYPTLNDQLISLAKIGPKNPPTFTTRTNDTSLTFNKLASDSFQFSFQYVYKDNEVSVLSPYSKLCTGDILPEVNSTDRAKILVSHTIDSSVSSLVKEVRLLYRKNNDPNWYVWKRLRNFSSTIEEYFFNNEQGTVVPESEATKLFDLVPNKSRALTIFRGRLFLNISEEGFDFVPPTVTCSLASAVNLSSDDIAATNVQSRGAFLKKRGSYQVGIFFRDGLGRLSGIVSKSVVHGPAMDLASTYNINANPTSLDAFNRSVRKFNVSLSGVGPPNCEYFIGITKEQNYEQYVQIPAHLLWYYFTNPTGPTSGLPGAIRRVFDKYYFRGTPLDSTRLIHFLLPKNIPFVPDTDCFVRFVSQNIERTERIMEVIGGDIVVTSDFGMSGTSQWPSQPSGIKGVPFIEIFKPRTVIEPFFYQIAGPFTTDSAGNFQTPEISNIDGDTFYYHIKSYNFRLYKLTSFDAISGQARKNEVSPALFIESPSPITKRIQASTEIELSGDRIDTADLNAGITKIVGTQPDHTKIAFSRGFPVVEAKPMLQHRPATIRFSDPYIEGSEVNGLNSFPVGNAYDKIGQDRSPITKLIPVGNNLIAVHERHVTSIYVSEGIVRAGETGFITKVENVVGDDRKMNGEWGSYHPESVKEIEGQLFGFDIYSGCVWRYTVEGLIAISDFGLENHFKERSEKYFPYRDRLRFVAAIDRYHKEYLITLPHLYLTKDTIERKSTSGSSYEYNLVLGSGYVSGKTYRVKITPYNQVSSSAQDVIIDAYFDNDTDQSIVSGLQHKVSTTNEDEAEAIYLEFLYEGQGYITLKLTQISANLYLNISTEYQELTGETWAFNYRARKWSHRYIFVPEFMAQVGTRVILFEQGRLYQHSKSETYNNFFGRQYGSRIEIEANPQPGKDKTWTSIQIDRSTLAVDPTLKVIEASNDHGQQSYTRAKEFDHANGVYLGPILKDVNTNPALIPSGTSVLREGKDIRSKTLNVVVNCDSPDVARLQKLNVLGQFSEFST